MNEQHRWIVTFVALALLIGLSQPTNAQYAVQVVSYDQGTTPAIDFDSLLPDNLPAAALGSPLRINGGMYPGVVSPFDPPFLRDDIVSIGEGGQLTLRLSNYAIPQAGVPEIGVFAHPGLQDFGGGLAGPSPVSTFSIKNAMVDVSADGVSWASLNDGKPITFDIPSNGYTDLTDPYSSVPGSVLSDFQQPFTETLDKFRGLKYYDAGGGDILSLLAGSGGGTWLDISNTGLSQVGYIRFSVADDGNPSIGLNFELDAVSVSHAAMGAATVPEPATIGLAVAALIAGGSFARVTRARRS